MFDLNFAIEGAEPQLHAATPAVDLNLRVSCSEPNQQIQNVLLQCQIQIEATRRRYNPTEQQNLVDLFGAPQRWSKTLRTVLWTHVSVTVPPFVGETAVKVHVPCTFDFNVATTKYFYGLEEGDIPLEILFSGSIFFLEENGFMRLTRIPWEKEAKYRLPVSVWRDMMDHFYPNSAWLCLNREIFDKLYQFKLAAGLATWEEAVQSLLNASSLARGLKNASPAATTITRLQEL